MAPTQRHQWFTLPDNRESRRSAALLGLALDQARADFAERHPDARFAPVVALIAAYHEEANIGDVLAAMPATSCGLEVSTLVIVDGGTDDTATIAVESGVFTCVLPVNLGQGAALRLGYELASTYGARYVVTLDADGQNDPREMDALVQPVVDGSSDFVIASRRLGVDETTDRLRRAGVQFYAWTINTITRQHLTDSSNGYRAFRIEVLDNIAPLLAQDQYQTAEVVIVASSRGWRITQVPAQWHPRASGTSKKGGNIVFGFAYAKVIATTWTRVALSSKGT